MLATKKKKMKEMKKIAKESNICVGLTNRQLLILGKHFIDPVRISST